MSRDPPAWVESSSRCVEPPLPRRSLSLVRGGRPSATCGIESVRTPSMRSGCIACRTKMVALQVAPQQARVHDSAEGRARSSITHLCPDAIRL
eukprot:5923745-Prymnesium_polylepis.1